MASCKAREVLYDSAEKLPPCVFLIIDGKVEILQGSGRSMPVPVGQAGPGQLVGEFTAIDGIRGRNVVRAMEPVQVLTIPENIFRSLVEQHPPLALNLLREMIGIIRTLNDRVARIADTHSEFERIRKDLFRFVV
jgi:CRP-like cAMP-binding protein